MAIWRPPHCVSKEVLYTLNTRVKELTKTAEPEQIAYLAKAIESVAGQSTVYDIVTIAEEKLSELEAVTENNKAAVQMSKNTFIDEVKKLITESQNSINSTESSFLNNTQKVIDNYINLIDKNKEENIETLNNITKESIEQIDNIIGDFKAVNDIPTGSSIMKEIGMFFVKNLTDKEINRKFSCGESSYTKKNF